MSQRIGYARKAVDDQHGQSLNSAARRLVQAVIWPFGLDGLELSLPDHFRMRGDLGWCDVGFESLNENIETSGTGASRLLMYLWH